MPDILIRGMEMPDEQPVTLILDPSGRVWLPDIKSSKEYMASELPPHGDLIDLQAMLSESENGKYVWAYDLTDLPEFTKDLPVVVPAERRDADA